MAITLRQESTTGASTKNASLSFSELDNNFIDLLNNKIQALQVDADTGTVTLGEAQSNGVFQITGGTGVTTSVSEDSAGNAILTIDQSSDNNTTYTVSAVDSGSDAIIRLTGNDASTDDITLAAGANITITPVGDTITIAATDTDTGILNVVEDTTPQLGGTLDANGNTIDMGTNTITDTKVGQWDTAYGWGDHSTEGYLTSYTTELSEDTTPVLGGNLDANSNNITNLGTVNTHTIPGGTGTIALTSDITFTDVVDDTTPQLGGDLDGQGNDIGDVELVNYKETVYSLGTTSGTITPDVANGNVQSITLSGNLTFSAFANPEAGQSMTLIIDTNGASRTLTSTMKFSGGNSDISDTDTIDIMTVFYDGTNYYASIAQNFS